MVDLRRVQKQVLTACAGLVVTSAVAFSGCKSTPAVDDATLTASIQSQLSTDTALAGQTVQPTVQQGVVTLNGNVANEAQRTIAARDAAGVQGVSRVVNAITVGPSSATATTAPPAPIAVAPRPRTSAVLPPAGVLSERERRDQQLQAERSQQPQYSQPAPIERQPPVRTVAPPPPPAFRTVNVPAGSTVPVRMTQTLDSATTQAGSTFSGVVASDILADGVVAIPAGSTVTGVVDNVQDAGHFRGASLLSLSLSTITRRGEHLAVTSDPYSVQGRARGANTAEKVGGGAAVGAILGGILGGGRGAAIGAAAGGGTGAGVNAITRGQQVQIASESVVRFHTASPITVRVRTDGADQGPYQGRDNQDPTLQHHN